MKKQLLFLMLCFAFSNFAFAQTTLLSEDFESGVLPAAWTVQQTNASETWGVEDIGGNLVASVNYDANLLNQDETLVTSSVDLTAASPYYYLKFKVGLSYYYSIDPFDNYNVVVKASTDNGVTWTQIWDETQLGVFSNYDLHPVNIDISSYAGNPNVKFAFQYTGNDGAALYLDDVKVQGLTEVPKVPECVTLNSPADNAVDVPYLPAATFDWTPASTGEPATSYDVYLDGDLLGNTSNTSVDITGLLGSTTHTWQIIAKNDNGDSAGCSEFTFTTAAAPPAPDCPTLDSPADGATDVSYFPAADFSWTPASTGEPTTSYDFYLNGNLLGNTANTDVGITGLEGSTTYTWQVIAKTEGGDSVGCSEFTFTTGANPAAPYCGPLPFVDSFFGSDGDEPITRVTFAGLDNSSDATEYTGNYHEFFLGQSATVTAGDTYTISLEGNTAGGFTDNFVAFIDWNQNNILDDAGEVYQFTETLTDSDGTDGQKVTLSITVPNDAKGGTTRMRIKKNWEESSDDLLDPCLGGDYGQAEDYTVNVTALATSEVSKNSVRFYPNPVKDFLNLETSSKAKSAQVYDMSGKMVLSSELNNSKSQLNFSRLSAGTYLVKVQLENEVKTFKVLKK